MKKKEQLTASRASKYWGCQVEYRGNDGRIPKFGYDSTKDDYNFVFTMTGIELQTSSWDMNRKEYYLKGILVDDEVEVPVKECQLVLKRLEDISDEHAIEIAKLYNYVGLPNWMTYKIFKNKFGGIVIKWDQGKPDYFEIPVYNMTELKYELNSVQIDKLRELGYDVDNAISEGWAVDAKTTEQ